MTDEITLTLPRDDGYQLVAHLVLGGLAARLNLTLEHLEDMQLALDAVLDGTGPAEADGEVTVRMSVHDHALEAVVGPLDALLLDRIEGDAGDALGVRRVLESTVDDVHVDGQMVRLTKNVSYG
jgi:hypothetical protein